MPTLKSNQEKYPDIPESETASPELFQKKDQKPCTEEIWPMSSDISLPKPWTLLSKTPSRNIYAHITLKLSHSNSWSEISCQEEPPEPVLYASSILWILPELDWQLISVSLEAQDNSTDWLIVSERFSNQTDYSDYIKDSQSPFWESSSTEESISECTTPERPSCSKTKRKLHCCWNSFMPWT